MKLEIGIDLGTTNSVVGYFNNGKIEYLKFKREEVLPSVVLYQNGKVTVGEIAKKKSVSYSNNYISSSKTFMGDNEHIWEIEDRKFTPTDVAAEILKEIKKNLEKKFPGLSEIHAVITVPAYFKSTQIDETKKAGEMAGLIVKQIITEPVAAAIAYGFEDEVNQKLFIVDIGGGTFDTAILKVTNKDFETLAIDGDRKLGGDDFDKHILEFLLKHIRKEKGVNLSSQAKSGLGETEFYRAKQTLILESEEIKRELDNYNKYDIEIPNLFSGYNLTTSLTRNEFENLSKSTFDKIKMIIKRTLDDPQYETSDIDKIVLVGGSAKIPAIREFITEFFGKNPFSDKPLDKLVAMGATIVAQNNETVQIRDIISHSLGVELVGNKFSPILKKNQRYPLAVSQIYTTTADYQESVDINVYEGEDEDDVNNNDFYGGFSLSNIEQARAGVPQIEVTFEFDINRILKVTAKDLNTNSSVTENIDINKGKKKKITPDVKPFDIVLTIDVSTSMCGDPLEKAKEACNIMVTELIDLTFHKVGLVSFGSYGQQIANLSNDKNYLRESISNLYCEGSTNMAGGIRIADEVLRSATNSKLVILVTDGHPNSSRDASLEADRIKADTKFITIGIGNRVNEYFLRSLASTENDYYSGSDFSELANIFQQISNSLQTF